MKIINKSNKINSPLSQSNIIKEWFYLATEKYENNVAYIKKDNLGRNHNILYYEVKKHVSFLAYSHINEKLLEKKVVIIGRNSYEWIISYLSLLITGTTAVPLDSGLKEEEIENSISRIIPALVICDSTKFELIKTIKEKLGLDFKIYLFIVVLSEKLNYALVMDRFLHNNVYISSIVYIFNKNNQRKIRT